MDKRPLRLREDAANLNVVGVTVEGYLILEVTKTDNPEWLIGGRFENVSSAGKLEPGWIEGFIYPWQKPIR